MRLCILIPDDADLDRYDDWRDQAKLVEPLLGARGITLAYRAWTDDLLPDAGNRCRQRTFQRIAGHFLGDALLNEMLAVGYRHVDAFTDGPAQEFLHKLNEHV